MKWWNTV